MRHGDIVASCQPSERSYEKIGAKRDMDAVPTATAREIYAVFHRLMVESFVRPPQNIWDAHAPTIMHAELSHVYAASANNQWGSLSATAVEEAK